jgi:hypothetical protein
VYEHQLRIDTGSHGGQSGSAAYAVDALGQEIAYGVLSLGDESTTVVNRLTESKHGSIETYVANHLASGPDLAILGVEVEPSTVRAGQRLDSLVTRVHNYGLGALDDSGVAITFVNTKPRFDGSQTYVGMEPATLRIGPRRSVRLVAQRPITIPTTLEPGTYFVGVSIGIDDAVAENNYSSEWDYAQIQVLGSTYLPISYAP